MKSLAAYFVKMSDERTETVINDTLTYFTTRAMLYKQAFVISNIAILAINCSIPIINQAIPEEGRLWLTILSSAAAFITGILTLISVKDQWFRYRTAAETLKNECVLFNSSCEKYAGKHTEEKEMLFIQAFEILNKNELKLWKVENDGSDVKADDDNSDLQDEDAEDPNAI